MTPPSTTMMKFTLAGSALLPGPSMPDATSVTACTITAALLHNSQTLRAINRIRHRLQLFWCARIVTRRGVNVACPLELTPDQQSRVQQHGDAS
ncbi:hypothetical protein Fuma_03295 [Fuerstiella marisgermanici]|uniref:Uncharacterized protein n=1 Tax=Fuerstiella marisgermanici TaxID=1891926 RepID=A0A1P8WI15_9PLAN|nr:hypothetical protein Fuma_03295 [Fuerstiella marisgermanici]